jgi:hypothetical protein
MGTPCKRDCPDRSPTCHSTCKKYREYQQTVAWQRELREAERESMSAHCDGPKRRTGYCPQK